MIQFVPEGTNEGRKEGTKSHPRRKANVWENGKVSEFSSALGARGGGPGQKESGHRKRCPSSLPA